MSGDHEVGRLRPGLPLNPWASFCLLGLEKHGILVPEAGFYKTITALCQVFRKVLLSSHLADSLILPCPLNIAFSREVCDQSVTNLGSRNHCPDYGSRFIRRTAKPLVVGSNPTAALTLVFKACQISKSPIPGAPPPLSGDLSITVVAGMQDGTFPDARMR